MSMEIDPLDHAADVTREAAERQINEIRKRASVEINGPGWCLICNADVYPVTVGHQTVVPRWCSPECRREWELDE